MPVNDPFIDISGNLAAFETGYTPQLEEVPAPSLEEMEKTCREFFAPGGTLNKAEIDGFSGENRPQQLEMALAVARALAEKSNLCVEAPTGVGKSFAYLLPLILAAKATGKCSLISTATINLQEQLIGKDIPQISSLAGIPVSAAIAKGRHNYLCRRRFALLSGEQKDQLLPLPSLMADIARINLAIDQDFDGDIEHSNLKIDPATRDLAVCESGNCPGRKCEFFNCCYYMKARREWENADIVVANHALFFTDLAMRQESGGNPLLPDYGAVMLDEAHVIEDCAAERFGLHISKAGVLYTLNRLFNPDSAKGLLMRPGTGNLDLRQLVAAARDESYGFFAPYENLLTSHRETALAVAPAREVSDRFTFAMQKVMKKMVQCIDDEEDNSFKSELESLLDRCRGIVDAVYEFQDMRKPQNVYYAENDTRGGLTLHGTPVEMADILAEVLFSRGIPVILTSATLTVGNHFDYFISRTGFTGGRSLQLPSPFDPARTRFRIITDLPDPAAPDFIIQVAEILPQLLQDSDGRAFVLFTSYQQMRKCAALVREKIESRNWRLLIQGEGLSRPQLLREFKKGGNPVLFGTDSFWTGVDVPGEILSQVIITKLPFAVPGHPLTAAKLDKISACGRSPFGELSLPEAVLMFRQGVGRLIRRTTDSGIVTVLDRRCYTRNYGRTFLSSVPFTPEFVKAGM